MGRRGNGPSRRSSAVLRWPKLARVMSEPRWYTSAEVSAATPELSRTQRRSALVVAHGAGWLLRQRIEEDQIEEVRVRTGTARSAYRYRLSLAGLEAAADLEEVSCGG